MYNVKTHTKVYAILDSERIDGCIDFTTMCFSVCTHVFLNYLNNK
jgi:hypothetical protein